MNVHTLITIPSEEAFANCTLFFGTVHTGFPTAEIIAHLNHCSLAFEERVKAKAALCGVDLVLCDKQQHHATFIESLVNTTEGKLVVIDPDTIWWSNCEDFEFESLMAGRYVPPMWNEFAQCVSHDRLHTSFLVFKNCGELRRLLKELYPQGYNAVNRTNEYAPLSPFSPRVMFVNKTPLFWDTCSCLYNMIGGESFTEKHLECYDHINSSAFGDVMYEVMEYGEDLKKFHEVITKNPTLLKGMWKNDSAYYARMHNKVFTQSQI